MSNDVMDDLRGADPLRGTGLDESDERLIRVRRIVDSRVASAANQRNLRSGHLWPRWIALAAAAVVVAVAGSITLSLSNPTTGPSMAAIGVAIGPDGMLTCSGPGYTGPMRDEHVPFLPSYLPAGWHLGHAWAEDGFASGCYASPSLTVARTKGDGTVTESAMITGPIPGTLTVPGEGVPTQGQSAWIKSSQDVMIGARPGQLIKPASPKGPGELIWLWSDPSGRNWMMRSYGFSSHDGKRLAAALVLDGDKVHLSQAIAPAGIKTIFQRTGAPYTANDGGTNWHVTLGRSPMSGHDGEVTLAMQHYPNGALGLDGVFPDGDIVKQDNGQAVIERIDYGGLALQPRPGLFIGFDPPWSGGEPTLGSMSPAEWQKVVRSVSPVSPDDPRLSALALDETSP